MGLTSHFYFSKTVKPTFTPPVFKNHAESIYLFDTLFCKSGNPCFLNVNKTEVTNDVAGTARMTPKLEDNPCIISIPREYILINCK